MAAEDVIEASGDGPSPPPTPLAPRRPRAGRSWRLLGGISMLLAILLVVSVFYPAVRCTLDEAREMVAASQRAVANGEAQPPPMTFEAAVEDRAVICYRRHPFSMSNPAARVLAAVCFVGYLYCRKRGREEDAEAASARRVREGFIEEDLDPEELDELIAPWRRSEAERQRRMRAFEDDSAASVAVASTSGDPGSIIDAWRVEMSLGDQEQRARERELLELSAADVDALDEDEVEGSEAVGDAPTSGITRSDVIRRKEAVDRRIRERRAQRDRERAAAEGRSGKAAEPSESEEDRAPEEEATTTRRRRTTIATKRPRLRGIRLPEFALLGRPIPITLRIDELDEDAVAAVELQARLRWSRYDGADVWDEPVCLDRFDGWRRIFDDGVVTIHLPFDEMRVAARELVERRLNKPPWLEVTVALFHESQTAETRIYDQLTLELVGEDGQPARPTVAAITLRDRGLVWTGSGTPGKSTLSVPALVPGHYTVELADRLPMHVTTGEVPADWKLRIATDTIASLSGEGGA